MKIGLVNAPFPKYLQAYEPPIHLGYLSSFLKTKGHEVIIIDAGVRKNADQVIVDLGKIDCLGVHVDIHNIKDAEEYACRIKKQNGMIPSAVWGNLPTALPTRVLLENPSLDVAIKGEPEITFSEILAAMENGTSLTNISGCAFRSAGEIVENDDRPLLKDLDNLPDADRDEIKRSNSYPPFIGPPEGYLLTSRGCPYKCTFCSAPLHGKFRCRSPQRVVDEIERTVKKYGIMDFVFRDYIFAPKSRIVAICEEILARDLKIRWHCLIRVDMIDRELVQVMKKAGCHELNFGIESSEQEILDHYDKKTKLEHVYRTFDLCKEFNIHTMANIMLGTPYDTPESIRRTVDLFCQLDPYRECVTLFFPYPGTFIFDYCKERGILKTENWAKYYTDPWQDNEYDRVLNLSPDVVKALKKGFRRLLLRYFIKNMKKMTNPSHILQVRPIHLRQLVRDIKWW